MKKQSMFKKGLLIYLAILVVIVAAVDIFVWVKLTGYEETMNKKMEEQNSSQTADVSTSAATPTPTPANTPTPTPTTVPETVIAELADGTELYINGEKADLSAVTPQAVSCEEFDIMYTFSESYSEYADIENKVRIPSVNSYTLEVPLGAEITIKDAAGEDLQVQCTENEDGSKTYASGFVSSETDLETIKTLCFEAIKKYALFCTNDAPASEMAPYFPVNSQYLQVISSLDNSWYMKHSGLPTYTDETVVKYVGYSESLAYIEISMKQTILSSITGTYVETVIEHPVWFVKLDGEWKIGAIEF